MRSNAIRALACSITLLLISPTIPVNATEAPIIDYCGGKTSGKIRAITEGGCQPTELSLGIARLEQAEQRPTSLTAQMNARYLVANAAAKKKGYSLKITSGYRSLKRQSYLFQRAVKKNGSEAKASRWVLPPTKSNHPWGIAIDINYGVSGTKAKKSVAWLDQNGYKYGLCRRYKNEWWHFEPLVAPGTKCPKMESYPS